MALPDLLQRKRTHFVLWRPAITSPPPQLVIGTYRAGAPPALERERVLPLAPSRERADLWEIEAAACGLEHGHVYHYFFEVMDSHPDRATPRPIRCTDPTALTVDWRLLSPALPPPYDQTDRDPAAVVLYRDGRLLACDPPGVALEWHEAGSLTELPANNRLVIYELPTRWSRSAEGGLDEGVGTFRDVRALVDAPAAPTDAFASIGILAPGRAYLGELGVNALELLPPADSFDDRGWGYATSNYFAADFDLGRPVGQDVPTASRDLQRLIESCHENGLRFFLDTVMAFSNRDAYRDVNFLDFHVRFGHGDPEQNGRDAFGGDLFKYAYETEGYDPVGGAQARLYPARQLMKAQLARWMFDFHVDGLRLDSVNNIMSYDFVGEVTRETRAWWRERAAAQGLDGASADARFLVVGEELAVPLALIEQRRLDGLWNEHWKRILRQVILGRSADGEPSFERSVRALIDARELGFRDGAQAVNYVTSHDVEGFRNERLYNYLAHNGVVETERRIKLAFACLLTAVGIPMILAGEEFADQHDVPPVFPTKQTDSVSFFRLGDDWRHRIFACVARLVALRTRSDALAVNDTQFIHVDFEAGKRVLAWRRGRPADDPVVVVANFSDWGTEDPGSPAAEYVVPGWPPTPPGREWREITQDRVVPAAWIGREPLYPWEAKVYALV